MRSSPNDYDLRLGLKIAARRQTLGYTQQQVGEALGVSFQQIQKYEKGTNRVPASKYAVLCSLLGLTMGALTGTADDEAPSNGDRLRATKGGEEIAELYVGMSSHNRRLLLEVARAITAQVRPA